MKRQIFSCLLILLTAAVFAQPAPKPYGALPTKRQLQWQETDMYCIIHLSVATYTDKEWGYGDEDPGIFNPSKFSAFDIVAAAKAGGFKGVVVVAKHHDGFCLWPTKTTTHNISQSPYKNGKGDIVREYQLACEKLGMKMGIYCSPWDRNSPLYGRPEYVSQIYREQLKELYTNYGPLFMSWHDGANGGDGYYGGTRELRKIDNTVYYNWPVNWAITRKMQPGAAIFGDVGPDVRWVGNEEGHAGETSWATYVPEAPDPGKQPANGYNKYWLATEGTRNGKYWIPAECDVPLRPGWFYHRSQDGQSKSAYNLLDLYYKSVGHGACLDLGLSPDKDGQLTKEDVSILKQFGELLKQTFAVNLVQQAAFTASNIRGRNTLKYGTALLVDKNRYSYWATDDKILNPWLIADMHKQTTFNVIRLRENIKLGQRIDAFAIDAWENGSWKEISSGTSIGANRLIRLQQNVVTSKVRLRITGSAAAIALSDFGLFKEPVHLERPLISRDRKGNVSITTTAPVQSIHYTLDGTEPLMSSLPYHQSFAFTEGGTVKARAFESAQKASEVTIGQFGLSKAGWKVIDTLQGRGKPENAIDDDVNTIWSTLMKDTAATAGFPQEIGIDMGKIQSVKSFTYLPRQDKKSAGIADRYIIYISNNGTDWQKITEGEFSNIKSNPLEQEIPLAHSVKTRYFKLSVLHVISDNGLTVAELGVRLN